MGRNLHGSAEDFVGKCENILVLRLKRIIYGLK